MLSLATTRLIFHHISGGKSILASLSDRFDYGQNPEKTLDCTRKYRDFLGSARALRRLSDRICLEHDLSVIKNPKLHSKGKFQHYGQWLGAARPPSYKEQIRGIIDGVLADRPTNLADFLKRVEEAGVQVKRGRGGVISFRLPGQDRATRFRASTLGDGYGLEDVEAVICGRTHALAGELRGVEERLASTTKLMGAVVDYAKTRPVFDGYKAARYSKKYLAEHEEAPWPPIGRQRRRSMTFWTGPSSPGWTR